MQKGKKKKDNIMDNKIRIYRFAYFSCQNKHYYFFIEMTSCLPKREYIAFFGWLTLIYDQIFM